MGLSRWAAMLGRLRRLGRPALTLWHRPDYRLPITTLDGRVGLDPRRAELAAWYLRRAGLADAEAVRAPPAVEIGDLLRVHEGDYLEALERGDELARIFGVPGWDIPVDEVWNTLRAITGGTVAAVRAALHGEGPQLNLAGGMHHAGRARGGGFCPINDLAVAVKRARADGFAGQVVILDLDFHPPDGTADCLADDPACWIGSISGVDWGPLPGVDEVVLPGKAGPDRYFAALAQLLERAPLAELTLVLAGGDVRAGDPLGDLGLSEGDLLRRELMVLGSIGDQPAVWLPGGGYGPGAWRAVATIGVALATGAQAPIPPDVDPLADVFDEIWRSLQPAELDGGAWLSAADLPELLGPAAGPQRLLGLYSPQGLELALCRYGLLGAARRLGYHRFRVELDAASAGERLRLLAQGQGRGEAEHLLVELVVERVDGLRLHPELGGVLLFIHWLTLRHPLAAFAAGRPALPGQEVPGLGLAREASELLLRMARRLGLSGVALRPAWLHVAVAARGGMRFVDAPRQGRFLALQDLIAGLPLAEASRRVQAGGVWLDGRPYTWEADVMVSLAADREPEQAARWRAAVEEARAQAHFSWAPTLPAAGAVDQGGPR
ncbi:MAG: histone deacetylase [Deltaproteobacteria bacterium]|nr:histone deacetylase [Deltaproteobacteria bacterium]